MACSLSPYNEPDAFTFIVVFLQVKDVHSANSKASKEVENRLKEAEAGNSKAQAEQEEAKEQYTAWAEEWTEEHGTPPNREDRYWGNWW